MKPLLWLIGGTSEARALVREMRDLPVSICVSVATEYGAALIPQQENVRVEAERMDGAAMRAFLKKERPALVIDATHPYATVVTATVQEACRAENCRCLRLLRPSCGKGEDDYISVRDFAEAVELLNHVEGNIFLTTGSKNLPDFTAVRNFSERIALRILPMESSLQNALRLGYKPSQIICMQGPFACDLNVALLKKYQSSFMVTKDSGEAGGFSEKLAAAHAAGAKLIVIGRAVQETGANFQEILRFLQAEFGK